MQSFIDSWIEKHPFLLWLLQHPIISFVSLFLLMVLLFRLFSAIAYLVDKLWIWLLKSPVILIKSIFGVKNKPAETFTEINFKELAIEPEKIGKIIQHLETIDRQQQQIIKDIAILKERN